MRSLIKEQIKNRKIVSRYGFASGVSALIDYTVIFHIYIYRAKFVKNTLLTGDLNAERSVI